MSVEDQIRAHINEKYLGSKDIEVSDSIDFCKYFVTNYGDKQDELKAKYLKIEADLLRTGWTPPGPISHVVAEDPDDIPEFMAAPWQFGFTEDHSVKGKSKLVDIMDTVDNFLKKPYNSKTEPLQVLFAPGSQVGAPVPDWSMVLSIGMGKSSAARMILEAVSVMNLDHEALKTIAAKIKALLRMRCTYEPAANEEEQLEKALAGKNRVTQRPRPCPLTMAARWEKVIVKQGLHFASVIDAKIKKFNADKNEGFGILDHEIDFIKAYPHQSKQYNDLLDEHWQNFKLKESAVPPSRFAYPDLSPDTKLKRCEKSNVLFCKIFTWSTLANVLWLAREIGVFLRAIKDAQRANKRVNLATNSKAFRRAHNEISHDEICIFVYFMPQFQQHTTVQQMADLMSRLSKGYLDKELNEKARMQDPALTVHDFRFLSMVTGKQLKVPGPGSLSLEERAEDIEVMQFKEKLTSETEKWVMYKRQLDIWQAATRKQKREDNQAQETQITKFADTWCSTYMPVSKLSEDGVIPYICECLTTMCEKAEISKERVFVIFLARFDQLGQKYHTNLNSTVRILSDFINQEPAKSGALVLAPNTGKDDAYNELAIDEAMEEVEKLLREDTYSFRVRRGSVDLEEESLGGPRSKRPGFCTIWRVQSDEKDPQNPNPKKVKYLSELEPSFMFKRGRAEQDLKVLANTDYVNPCAALVRQSQGADGLTKAQRSKQWHTGVTFWNGFTSSVLKGLGLRVTDAVAWVDLLPYDDKLQHSIIQAYSRRSSQEPTQMVISPIWANMGHHGRGPEAVEKVDNSRIEAFLKKSVRNFCASRIRDGSLKFSEVPVVDPAQATPATEAPTLDSKQFVKTCPNAAGFLPLRQDILDLLQQKVTSEKQKQAVEKLIEEHNKKHNPSGVPFKGEAKRPAPRNPDDDAEAQAAKVYPPESDGPRSRDEFSQEHIIVGQKSDHEFMVKDGRLWGHALDDCIISSQGPVVKFWGEYLCGSDKKKEIAKNQHENYMWEVNSYDFIAAFGKQQGKKITEYKDYLPCKLSEFMAHLEDSGRVNINVECHDIKEITEQAASSVQGSAGSTGVEETRYEVKCTEDCLFLPKSLPARSKPNKGNAASAMDFSQWNFKARTHKLGRVHLMMTMHYDEEANSIIPVKPMVYLVAPIKMKKGDFVLLG